MAKPKSELDEIDLEAEREGSAISKSNENRVKKANKKPKVKSVNSKMLDKSFFERYGYSGYTAKGIKDE